MNKATEAIVKSAEAIFPHRLYESREAFDHVRKAITQIPTGERATVLKELQDMKTGLGSRFGDENWAICVGLFGADASGCAARAWAIAKEAWSRSADLGAICDALRQMSGGLPPLTPEIVSKFDALTQELAGAFARCTNEAARFAIGVERPCALVRLLGSCGASAQSAVPSLKKYKSFIASKRFIQSSMLVLDLDAGSVTPPPATPVAQVKEALRAIQGPGFFDKIGSIFSGKK